MKTFDASTNTDAQLVERYADCRDQEAFAELVRRHASMVFGTARRVLPSQEDTEEAFQAAFFALAKGIETIRDPAAVAGWLHRAAYSCAAQIQRANVRWEKANESRERQLELGTINHSNEREPSMNSETQELEKVLDLELNRLPGDLKTAVVLCDLDGLTQKQAGQRLGVAASTVNDRVVKGRRILRQRLTRQGVTMAGLAGLLTQTKESSAALTEQLVADTIVKAPLFAAGQTAAELGVSSNVLLAADKVRGVVLFGGLTLKTAVIATLAAIGSVILLVPLTASVSHSLNRESFVTLHYWRFEDSPGFLRDSVGDATLSPENVVQVTIPNNGRGRDFPYQIPGSGANRSAADSTTAIAGLTADTTPVETAFTIELFANIDDLSPGNGVAAQRAVLASQATEGAVPSEFSWAFVIERFGADWTDSPPAHGSGGKSTRRELELFVSNGQTISLIPSGILIRQGTDYFLSAAFDVDSRVRFYVKNLIDGTVETTEVSHSLSTVNPDSAMSIAFPASFSFVDGLIDEVRLSRGVVPVEQLLVNEAQSSTTENN